LTDFRYLRNIWKTNTEEEALLGVSLTGIMDHPCCQDEETRQNLRSGSRDATMKQSRTNKSSGLRNWVLTYLQLLLRLSLAVLLVSWSIVLVGFILVIAAQYIRRVSADARDPLCAVLEAAGVPVEDDVMSPSTKVFSFPIASPEGAVTASDMGAMEQLELWEIYQDYWCEHKPSMTCYYRDEEFLEVGQWLYNKFDKVSGYQLPALLRPHVPTGTL
jgi:ribonucleoside-triphosphate reductase